MKINFVKNVILMIMKVNVTVINYSLIFRNISLFYNINLKLDNYIYSNVNDFRGVSITCNGSVSTNLNLD